MEVFLVPVGPDAHEPYCEVEEDLDQAAPPDANQGLIRRLVERFRAMLAAAEAERRRSREGRTDDTGWPARAKRRALRWLAERVAEQRLLWHLRRHDSVTLAHPDDMTSEAALAAVRASLKRDADRHKWWLLIDTLLLIASGALMLVPGPNLLAYYFAFRVVGHFLSWRGARHGLHEVKWTPVASGPLTELRRALAEDRVARRRRVQAVAARLRLEDLPRFFDRMTLGRA